MKGNSNDVYIDPNISYSLKTNSFNKSLKLVNHSPHVYVFKIKTNQKTVVSLQTTHDFIMPESTKQIAIKLADKPSETNALKLQFNYAIASEQDIANKDSKMNSYPKDSVYKKIITIERKDDPESQERLSSKTQKIEVQFASSGKSANQIQGGIKFPTIDLTKSQVIKISESTHERSQEIDITDLIKMEKSAIIEAPKKQELPTQKQTTKTVPKKIQISSQSLTAKKEISKQPQNQKKENLTQKSTSNLLESSKDYNTFVAMQVSENNDSTFRMTESVVVDIPPEPLSKKNEKQIVIEELNEKIERQQNAIRNIREKNKNQSSVYPLSLILTLIIVSFCVGSALNWWLYGL